MDRVVMEINKVRIFKGLMLPELVSPFHISETGSRRNKSRAMLPTTGAVQ